MQNKKEAKDYFKPIFPKQIRMRKKNIKVNLTEININKLLSIPQHPPLYRCCLCKMEKNQQTISHLNVT